MSNKITNICSYHIKHNIRPFLLWFFFIFVPPFLGNIPAFHEAHFGPAVIRLCNLITYSIVIALAFTFARQMLSNFKAGRFVGFLLLAVSGLISMIETITMRLFNLRYENILIQLVHDTNKNEAHEFISEYLKNSQLILIVFIYAFVCLCIMYLCRTETGRKYFSIVALCGTLLTSAISIISGVTMKTDKKEFNAFPWGQDSYSCIVYAVKEYNTQKNEVELCRNTNINVNIDSCTYRSTKIIIVIGESFNRHHSSLYGYRKNTNPELAELSNLFVFTDVITPMNATSHSFKQFLSSGNVYDNDKWYEKPLFPVVFRAAGYQVCFMTNQFPKHSDIATSQSENDALFITDNITDSCCFDIHNSKTFQYDNDLITNFERNVLPTVKDTGLIVFHLMGQHVKPSERFPSDFKKFHADDYYERQDLTIQERQQIADYDNATLFNDHVVRQIINMFIDDEVIVVYFADHGDEANDFRKHVGRSYDFSGGADVLRNQLDIPFIIWASDKYIQSHNDIIKSIESSLSKPFMIDNLPQVLYDIAGIHSQWTNPNGSVINSEYQQQPRMVGNSYSINYDSKVSSEY